MAMFHMGKVYLMANVADAGMTDPIYLLLSIARDAERNAPTAGNAS